MEKVSENTSKLMDKFFKVCC